MKTLTDQPAGHAKPSLMSLLVARGKNNHIRLLMPVARVAAGAGEAQNLSAEHPCTTRQGLTTNGGSLGFWGV